MGIYIPCGWWHQGEGEPGAVSVTHRWNPYSKPILNALKSWYGGLKKGMPKYLCDVFFSEGISMLPESIQALAPRWSQCFIARLMEEMEGNEALRESLQDILLSGMSVIQQEEFKDSLRAKLKK